MADNVTLNPGSGGAVVAADDISSVFYQRVKVSHGADGSATDTAVAAPLPVHPYGVTSGGASISRVISAASTNATTIKGSAGQVYGVLCFNTNAAARYLKLYNKATSPTVGTDTPVITITIPGGTTGGGVSFELPQGIAFATGIASAITTGAADADTGAVASAEIIAHVFYK